MPGFRLIRLATRPEFVSWPNRSRSAESSAGLFGPYVSVQMRDMQGSGVFAISSACHRRRRIAASWWTLRVAYLCGLGFVWRETGAIRNARPSRGRAASTRKRTQWEEIAKPPNYSAVRRTWAVILMSVLAQLNSEGLSTQYAHNSARR
jgi:hypothetical protein